MAGGYTREYSKGTDTVIATYNFQELATGQSMLALQGIDTVDSAGINYVLSSIPPRSATTVLQGATFDADFDAQVLRPITLDGKMFISCKFGSIKAGSAPQTVYIIFRLRKVRDGVESEIISVQTVSSGPVTVTTLVNATVDMIVPRTTFKKGDTIRLSAQGVGGNDGNNTVALYHDTATAGNEFKVWLPVETK